MPNLYQAMCNPDVVKSLPDDYALSLDGVPTSHDDVVFVQPTDDNGLGLIIRRGAKGMTIEMGEVEVSTVG